LFTLYANSNVRNMYIRYSNVPSKKGISGRKIAGIFLSEFEIKNVNIEETNSILTDHYDPVRRVIRLSREVSEGSSLASIGIAAHESGHALQHAQGYFPFKMRLKMAPCIKTLAIISLPLGLLGIMFNTALLDIAALCMIVIITFYVISLPIEFDASNRAIMLLKNKKCLNEEEIEKVRKILIAAALTYIAGTLFIILNFLSSIRERNSYEGV